MSLELSSIIESASGVVNREGEPAPVDPVLKREGAPSSAGTESPTSSSAPPAPFRARNHTRNSSLILACEK